MLCATRFSPVLFRAHPEQFITYLIAVPRSGVGSWQTVDPRRLLPALRVALASGPNSEVAGCPSRMAAIAHCQIRRSSATKYLTHCCCSPGGNRIVLGLAPYFRIDPVRFVSHYAAHWG